MWQIQVFTFNPFSENTYLVYNEEKQGYLIDAGNSEPAESSLLFETIEKEGITILGLLQTHCHIDHVLGMKTVAEKYGVQPRMHPNEEPVLARMVHSARMYGIVYQPYTGDYTPLHDGEKIKAGKDEFEVIFVPGHAPGHIAFYCAAQNFVIGGDVLFEGSIGRTDLPGSNHEDLIRSIQTRLYILPDETRVFPGHGGDTTIGAEKKTNPFVRG